MEINQNELELCIQIAKSVGSPRDQVDNFISRGYIPLPWQWEFHAKARLADIDGGPVDLGTGGARGPGKSHAVLSQVAIDDCQRVSGLKCLFLRQTGVAAKESLGDLVDKVLRGRIDYVKTGELVRLGDNCRILLGGFKDASDIDKYIGIEYDIIIVEELNQLNEDKYEKLRGSLRTSKPNWRPRMYTSFNPGGIGHAFVKNRYIIPFRKKQEKETRFIGSTYKSNPYLNKEYIEYLEGLKGDLGKAWREGEWEIFAGQFFSEFRYDLHTCKPFIPLSDIPKYGGKDWGRVASFVFLAAALDVVEMEDGRKFHRMWIYQEVDGTEKTPKQWAKIIADRVNLNEFIKIQCDTKMFSPGDDGSISITDQFKNAYKDLGYNPRLKKSNKDRISGWSVVHDWLSIAPDGLPYLMITENCVNLITTLPELIHDDIKVEDVDTTGPDHWADALRYMLKHVKWIDGKTGGIKPKEEKKYKSSMITKLDLDAFGKIGKVKRTHRSI